MNHWHGMKARSKSCCTLSSMCIYLSMDVTVSYVLRAEWSLYEYLCIQHFRYILFIRSMNIVFGCALCVCGKKSEAMKTLTSIEPHQFGQKPICVSSLPSSVSSFALPSQEGPQIRLQCWFFTCRCCRHCWQLRQSWLFSHAHFF